MNLLTVDNLRVTYSESGEPFILDGLSFIVNRGEWASIIGPSGCGKTTLLHCIAGLRSFTGTILLSSRQPGGVAAVGYVFQTPRLLNWLTLRHNVALALRAGMLSAAAEVTVNQQLEECQIAHLADRYPLYCSEGEKTRAAIARALSVKSELLLMDEPFGTLDQITADTLRNNVQQWVEQAGTTVLLVTHNLTEAVWLSDRVLVMSRKPARIVAEVPVGLPRPRHEADRAQVSEVETKLRTFLEGA